MEFKASRSLVISVRPLEAVDNYQYFDNTRFQSMLSNLSTGKLVLVRAHFPFVIFFSHQGWNRTWIFCMIRLIFLTIGDTVNCILTKSYRALCCSRNSVKWWCMLAPVRIAVKRVHLTLKGFYRDHYVGLVAVAFRRCGAIENSGVDWPPSRQA
jgi:hypothetical protein